MSKYGNKKCLKFNGTGWSTTWRGFYLSSSVPVSCSSGVFGGAGSSFTLATWVKADFSSAGSGQPGQGYSIYQAIEDPESAYAAVKWEVTKPGTTMPKLRMSVRWDTSLADNIDIDWNGIYNPALYNDGTQWLHIVTTFNGDVSDAASCTSYFNGVSGTVSEVDNLGGAGDSAYTVDGNYPTQIIGGEFQGGDLGRPFNGSMADFSIWNKELTSTEVSELYNDGRLIDLNGTSMEANLVQWNKCGNYYKDTNPASILATTTASYNVASNGLHPAPTGNLDLIVGTGYGPTQNVQIVDDPVSTDMIFMDGFDQNTSPSTAMAITALDLRLWQNTVAIDPNGGIIQRGGGIASAITAHWPKLDYSNNYVTSNKSKYLNLYPASTPIPTAHGSPGSQMNEIYNTFDRVTSGTVNLGFAIRIPRNAGNAVAGDLESTVCGFYWGDSNQPNPSSSTETGRLSVQFMGGTYSYLGWKPQLRRALAGDDAGTFTTVAEGPEGTFTTGGQDFLQAPLTNPIPESDRYWYWVDAEIYPAETGSFKLYVNNSATPAINYTGDTRGVNNTEVIDFMGFRFRQTPNAGPIVIDDVVAFHNKKATEQYCVALVPDAENFTGSFDTGSSTFAAPAADCLQSINGYLSPGEDGAIAATGTFMVTTTDPDSASFSYDNLPFAPESVQGVQAHNLINMDGVTFTSIQNNLITGSVGLVTGSDLVQPNPGSWEMVSELYSWHPTSSVNTSEDFSSADLNAIIDELKVK
jgi:hypothetical protein